MNRFPPSNATPPASAPSASGLQAQLEVLRAAYASRLDEKIEVICQGWATYLALRAGGESEMAPRTDVEGGQTPRSETIASLHRAAHTLAGSGATFGFPAVSSAARRVETLIKDLMADETGFEGPGAQRIEAALADLRRSSRVQAETEAFAGPAETTIPSGVAHPLYLFSNAAPGTIEAASEPSWAASIRAFGYRVEFFHRLDQLEAALKRQTPAALIVDCHTEPMECGQGGALLSGVLSEAQRAVETPIPVVWVCIHGDLRSRLQTVRLGGAAFFATPLDTDSLLVKLDDLTAHAAPEPFRILIVDDEPSLGRLFSVILKQAGMETLVVSDPMQVMAPLVDFRPDLILMDVYMPGCSGVELASVVRQQEAYIGIPIMFLSVETDVSKQLEAMRQGGDDFLIKPVQPRHLISAVTTRATRARSLRNLMVRDSLTGLLNHTKTKEQLGIELDRARRLGTTVCLAMLDIDNFKVVNDTYGHATGDRVLRSLSRLLGQRLRQTDVIGRYGGEEFAVIMTGSGVENARHKLEIVREAFAGLAHFCDGQEFRVTFSAGIAAAPPFGDAVKLSEAADRALYEAKRAGRNCTLIATREEMWSKRGGA